ARRGGDHGIHRRWAIARRIADRPARVFRSRGARADAGAGGRRNPSGDRGADAPRLLMRTDLFDFDLPEDRIALRPVAARDAARLLVVHPGAPLEDRIVRELPELLRPGDA